MTEKLDYIKKVMQICFVPELTKDLDSVPISNNDFEPYHQALQHTLPNLFDLIQQNETWLFQNDGLEIQQIHASLIILLCELDANAEAVYKLQNTKLQQNANRLLRSHSQLPTDVEDIIFSHYRSKLHKACWKRQLGSVHGFLRYLAYRHKEAPKNTGPMATTWLTFSLSVGLNVRECHDPVYKAIGTRIFNFMLNYGSESEIKELNLHSVIYEDVFKDVHVMDTVVGTSAVWGCLCKCLDFYTDCDSMRWSRVDDLLEMLLRNIAFASDSLITIYMMKYITKLCCYFSSNRLAIEQSFNGSLSNELALQRCRCVCADNTSYTIFRFAKIILNMFTSESYKLMQSPAFCRPLLLEMHRCYMVAILPITLPAIEPLLATFFERFTGILMEVLQMQKDDKDIVKLITSFIETFVHQLNGTQNCGVSKQCMKFRDAFQELLKHDMFKTYNN